MRTRLIVACAALIAAFALVAIAGPASTQPPGAPRSIDPATFERVAIGRPVGPAATVSPLDPGRVSAGSLPDEGVLRDPGDAPGESGRPPVTQPTAPTHAALKPGAWRLAEYSWYGPGFYGSGTACGQTYSTTIMGVAHKTLPCGTRVTFRNPKNGRTVTVRVIDRGPYVSGRMWDLSRGTCEYLGNCYTSRIQWRLP